MPKKSTTKTGLEAITGRSQTKNITINLGSLMNDTKINVKKHSVVYS